MQERDERRINERDSVTVALLFVTVTFSAAEFPGRIIYKMTKYRMISG